MFGTLCKCGLAGGLILFVFGVVSWTIFPWQTQKILSFTNEAEVEKVMRANAPISGIYLLPNVYASTRGLDQAGLHVMAEQQNALIQKGPVVFASIEAEGQCYGRLMISSVGHLFLLIAACAALGALVSRLSLSAFMGRLAVVGGVGLFLGVLGAWPLVAWWGFPFSFVVVSTAHALVGWLLAGLVIARLTSPKGSSRK